MGAGPVSGLSGRDKAKWTLDKPHDTETQGLVVSGFASLNDAVALFLEFGWQEGGERQGRGRWLEALESVAPISDADGADPRAAALAFTWSGLKALGLPGQVLDSFSNPFKEGMFQVDRLRRLGDHGQEGNWTDSVIAGGPVWGGNAHIGGAGEAPDNPVTDFVVTPKTVHALLLLYDGTAEEVEVWKNSVTSMLAGHDITVAHALALKLETDAAGIGREHFGFADGISQPLPYSVRPENGVGDENAVLLGGSPVERDYWNGVPLGEILFGHTNAHHEKAPGPLVPDDSFAAQAKLRHDAAPVGFRNLGLDGSYMVVRELRQDTAAFWKSMEEGADRIRSRDPSAGHVTCDWLAERIVGRDRDGHLLRPQGPLPPDCGGYPQNDFGFRREDTYGIGCPIGSHVRRANPRDGLAKDVASAETLLDSANSHRILRRGRKYGKTAANPAVADGEDRGLLFICLNTDIARQFEFVQQTWILNSNFATLFEESDPLVGPHGNFTIPEEPLRRIVEVETFVRMAGGDYFFMPSISALRYLAQI